jgi:gag-polyprotein putative aspartyl protease
MLAISTAACASKPIRVKTAAIVTLDTAGHAVRMRPATARNFWDAMTRLDPDYVVRHSVGLDEKAFANALRMVMAGDADNAELLLDSLQRHSADSTVKSASHILLTAMLQYQGKWQELAELAGDRPAEKDTSEVDRAGVEVWAGAFRSIPRREIVFPARPVVVPLTLSVAGTPVIAVEINGRLKHFWLDTGSSMSIVSSDVAAECGMNALVRDTLEVATATGRVAALPAGIQRLNIGGLSISNSTAMIVSSGLMEVRVGDASNPTSRVKIDGIVGFDIISRVNVEIDYASNVVRFSRPRRAEPGRGEERNFFWVGTPIVRAAGPGGVPLHFGLDTGAQETYATEAMLDRVRVRTFVGERKQVAGFGGLREFRGRFISELRLGLRGKTLLLQKLLVFVPALGSFASLDGVLGSDVGRAGVVRIDAVNGIFGIEESRPGR